MSDERLPLYADGSSSDSRPNRAAAVVEPTREPRPEFALSEMMSAWEQRSADAPHRVSIREDRWRRALDGVANLESTVTALRSALSQAQRQTEAAQDVGDADSSRLDWLEAWTKGDQGICPPGNHGGALTNWLIYREDDSRGDQQGRWSEEHEGPTLRDAIDAARSPSRPAAPREDAPRSALTGTETTHEPRPSAGADAEP